MQIVYECPHKGNFDPDSDGGTMIQHDTLTNKSEQDSGSMIVNEVDLGTMVINEDDDGTMESKFYKGPIKLSHSHA